MTAPIGGQPLQHPQNLGQDQTLSWKQDLGMIVMNIQDGCSSSDAIRQIQDLIGNVQNFQPQSQTTARIIENLNTAISQIQNGDSDTQVLSTLDYVKTLLG